MADGLVPMPLLREPVVDRYRQWNPSWWNFMKPFFKQTQKNVDAITGALAQIEEERTLRIQGDEALADDLTTLTTTVGNNTIAISENTSSINGIAARWGITINANNRVTGQIKLDGTATTSTFSVLADKFVVVHPSVNGTTITAFVVGLVNGVATVGINGNLIIDDTILARHIDVTSLSAIVANIGTITAGKLQRADGTMIIDLDNKRIKIST